MVRFPEVPGRLAVGVGLDLPWGGPTGACFVTDGARDGIAPRLRRFFTAHARGFSHCFVSWQPSRRGRPRIEHYRAAFDDLFATVPQAVRALHHTALNLGAGAPYGRGALLDFTNALVERYGMRWVNEDLGLWSLDGKPLPYPLPPLLTDAGLRAAIRATRECIAGLAVPLLVEFPGFSDEVSLVVGPWHAYDFFRALCEEARAPATLDVGHLLSWQWLRGRRGEALYEELERLPLDHCFELHLSGCSIVAGRFVDAHHGLLLDEQLELCARLLPLCPNLRAITFEDPRLDEEGALEPGSAASLARLLEVVTPWTRSDAASAL